MPAVDIQMVPPVEDAPAPAPPTKSTVGIIYPPPEVRNIVDKTANFVARNGPEFETRIRQNEINNPKFNFLNPADPYHAYYQHKVKDFREGKGTEPLAPKISSFGPTRQQQEVVKASEPIVPKEPPPEFEFIADPPSISAFDLDVVKLTAQFVARNGRQFLTNLMNREQRNYQFDFLRPQHSLFNYFTKLVEQYTKILIPPKDLLNKLKKDCDNSKEVLDQVTYRVEWAKYQERERQKEEAALEKERVAYAQIDWHDFVVVETVDFQASEQGNFPPPTTPEEVGARLLAQERLNVHGNDVEMDVSSEEEDEGEGEGDDEDEDGDDDGTANTQVQDMEEDSSDEEETGRHVEKQTREPREKASRPPLPPLPSQPPPLPPAPDQVIVRKDYNPKAPKPVMPMPGGPDQFLVSPITGEKIPADKLQEHMRIGLLDPKWIEQRDRSMAEKREQEDVYAPGTDIESSLKQLAERRTDIFGVGAEEAQIGKKIGEEEIRPKEKVTWDGHTASMEKVSQKARENITIEDQIRVIQMAKGLIDDESKERIGPAIPKHTPPAPKPMPPKPIVMPAPPVMRPPHPPPQPPRMPPMMVPMAPQPQGMVLLPPRPPMPPGGIRPPPHLMAAPPMQMMGQPPRGMAPPPQAMSHVHKPPMDEPPNKRQKTEESLIPEDQFMRMHPGAVTFKVAVPSMPDKPEWKLSGQLLTLSLPLTDNVSVIKAKLNEELGMPAGKQKLQYEGLFIKDSNTLAYYNFTSGSVVSLQLKERGGRKK